VLLFGNVAQLLELLSDEFHAQMAHLKFFNPEVRAAASRRLAGTALWT
jgi:hypothetical protein